jgi:hypothetical protein
MKEVQEKLLPGELGVSTRIFLLISPQDWGIRGLKEGLGTASQRRRQQRLLWMRRLEGPWGDDGSSGISAKP